jgi:hypothetical protein
MDQRMLRGGLSLSLIYLCGISETVGPVWTDASRQFIRRNQTRREAHRIKFGDSKLESDT